MITETFVQKLKAQAKGRSRAPGVSYARALNVVAVEAGFKDWQDVVSQFKASEEQKAGSAA